jgi:hypothetical protein
MPIAIPVKIFIRGLIVEESGVKPVLGELSFVAIGSVLYLNEAMKTVIISFYYISLPR